MSLPLTCTCGRAPLEHILIGVLSPPGVVGRFRCTRTGRPDGTDGCGRQYNAFADGRLVEVDPEGRQNNDTIEAIRANGCVLEKITLNADIWPGKWRAKATFAGNHFVAYGATTQSEALTRLTEYLRREGIIT